MSAAALLPIPENEQERLLSVLTYEILDTTNDEQLDELTVLAANIFNVPIALITIVDKNRLWCKANFGITIGEIERSISFCQYTIMGNDVFEVPNTQEDQRFALNKLVTDDPYIRYYCGAPLINDKGYRMGSLALLDYVPRQFEAKQKKALQLLAQQVVNFFELSATRKALEKEKRHLEERVVQRTKELENSLVLLQQRESNLAQSDKLLNKAQFIAKMGSWEYEVATNRIIGSEALYNLLQLNKDTDTLQTVEDYVRLIHPADVVRLKDEFLHFIQTGKGNQMDYRLLLTDGSIKFILSVGELHKEADGKVSKVWGISRDVTERKLAEQAIQQYAQQLKNHSQELEKINASKDKFFSIIAHDLQSPVSGIIGAIELLVNHLDKLQPAEISKLAEGIDTSAQLLKGLLKNLLEWATSQAGLLHFNPIQFNLRELATEVIELLNENAKSKTVQVKNAIGCGITVNADKNMIHSALRNLLSNAIKFSRDSGSITIACVVTPQETRVSVADNGIGMSESVQDQLFRIDSKHSTPGTANEQGTGLGLLLCKEFIEKHGGWIEVESREGQGTTFTFALPNPGPSPEGARQ